MLFAAATTVAIVKPGDLGDEEVASDTTPSTSSTTSITTTTTLPDTTSTTGSAVATTVPATTTTTVAVTSTTLAGATTTTISSGLGAEGSGNVNPDGAVAETGMESQLPLGLALAGLALAARRLVRPRAS